MNKKIGAILLVAGTCIGSGMIALPMVLAQVGLIPSLFLMLIIWFIMYYTSLINLELNLQAGRGLSLGQLGRQFSGRTAELIGITSLKLLSYSLLAVFIYGGTSIIQELLASKMATHYSFGSIAIYYTLIATTIIILPIKLIDYFNRILFICLIVVILTLTIGLVLSVEWSNLPLFSKQYSNPLIWIALIPVVFTSFGFQVIFHTLTDYCNKNAKILKQAFFWGSFIPAVVYILWTCSILSVVHNDNPFFYKEMEEGKAEVGELIQVLSGVAKWHSVQLLVWWISLLAIATSVLGVGRGLFDSLKGMISPSIIPNINIRNIMAALLTMGPAYLIVIYIPNAFITVLGFAGMILAVIAVLLPAYLFLKIKTDTLYYSELRNKPLFRLSIIVSILIISCELFNIFCLRN